MIYLYLFYAAIVRKKSTIVLFFIACLLFSYFLGMLIGKTPEINDLQDVFNMFFSVIILFMIIHGYNKYKGLKTIRPYKSAKNFKKLVNLILVFGGAALLINLFIVNKAFSTLLNETFTVQSYKNEGGAEEYLKTWVSPFLLMISRLLSPLGFFALGLHFYFLTQKKVKKSLLLLLISLNVPLLGLQGLSRSATILFLLTYIVFLIYIFPALSKKVKKNIIKYGLIVFGVGIFFLGIITTSRFSKYYNVPQESTIQNTVLYSLFDYASQWNTNGVASMREFSSDKISYGRGTVPLVSFIAERVGIDVEKESEARKRNFGKYYSTFNGVPAALLYDFGYIFTFIFTLFYFKITRKNAPINGEITLNRFINFGVLVPLPILFFANNAYSSLSLNIGIFYLLVFHFIVRLTK